MVRHRLNGAIICHSLNFFIRFLHSQLSSPKAPSLTSLFLLPNTLKGSKKLINGNACIDRQFGRTLNSVFLVPENCRLLVCQAPAGRQLDRITCPIQLSPRSPLGNRIRLKVFPFVFAIWLGTNFVGLVGWPSFFALRFPRHNQSVFNNFPVVT